jgi:omega-amidase
VEVFILKIALGQMDITWMNKEQNKEKCMKFLQNSSELGMDLILFPEMSLTGFSMKVTEIGELKGETLAWFKEMAIKHNINIGFGYVEMNGDKGKNVFTMISKNGQELSKYVKIHPFSYGGEDKKYDSGYDIVSTKIQDFNISTFICYDLRFPEPFQIASKEATLITIIANWPKSRRDHWITLLKARAIENQCYMAAVNRVGIGGGNIEYVGDSMIIDPMGNVISKSDETFKGISNLDSLIIGDINIEEVNELRDNFRLKADRKEDLYYFHYNKKRV